jgi:ATP-dependent helicase/nuclease subunit A
VPAGLTPVERAGENAVKAATGLLAGAARGIAVHSLLARMRLDSPATVEGVREEARRLQELGFIEAPGVTEQDVEDVTSFFRTPLGQALSSKPEKVRREVPFTMRVPAGLFADAGGRFDSGQEPQWADAVVVQGVIDVLIDEGDCVTILDYKSDAVPETALQARLASYRPQVSLYALATERILRKPVRRASVVFLRHTRAFDVEWRGHLRARGFGV